MSNECRNGVCDRPDMDWCKCTKESAASARKRGRGYKKYLKLKQQYKMEKIKASFLKSFKPSDKAPAFIKASVMLNIDELNKFVKENQSLLSEYKGQKQLRLTLMEGEHGFNFQVDTYKPKQKEESDFAF